MARELSERQKIRFQGMRRATLIRDGCWTDEEIALLVHVQIFTGEFGYIRRKRIRHFNRLLREGQSSDGAKRILHRLFRVVYPEYVALALKEVKMDVRLK